MGVGKFPGYSSLASHSGSLDEAGPGPGVRNVTEQPKATSELKAFFFFSFLLITNVSALGKWDAVNV